MATRWNWKGELAARKTKVEGDRFLHEWLRSVQADRSQFETSASEMSAEQRQSCALQAGFRTWSDLRKCQRDTVRTIEQYVNHSTFARLWKALRKWEEEVGLPTELFGPHNGGVPCKLLRDIETWHRSPKFTATELLLHKAKIAKKCDELVALIAQVSPGNFGDRFSTFHLDAEQANAVFRSFESPKRLMQVWGKHEMFVASRAEHLLQRAGITPSWAANNIKECALRGAPDILPTKVRAPTAFRTYLIHSVCGAVSLMTSFGNLPISDRLIADVVALLSNMDCTSEDVRATMKARRARDRNWTAEDTAREIG